ncbi:hypothetical protein X946_5302 [Burkholderia sp. ABCPW 111]|nr:hypothetical protein X946_5302 [Burkholderia sp. ABCPW 111]
MRRVSLGRVLLAIGIPAIGWRGRASLSPNSSPKRRRTRDVRTMRAAASRGIGSSSACKPHSRCPSEAGGAIVGAEQSSSQRAAGHRRPGLRLDATRHAHRAADEPGFRLHRMSRLRVARSAIRAAALRM